MILTLDKKQRKTEKGFPLFFYGLHLVIPKPSVQEGEEKGHRDQQQGRQHRFIREKGQEHEAKSHCKPQLSGEFRCLIPFAAAGIPEGQWPGQTDAEKGHQPTRQ